VVTTVAHHVAQGRGEEHKVFAPSSSLARSKELHPMTEEK